MYCVLLINIHSTYFIISHLITLKPVDFLKNNFMIIIMNIQILKFIFVLIITTAMCAGFYMLGRSQAETKIVKEQIEVIKYVNVEQEKEYAKEVEIYAAPNSDFTGIVNWLRGTGN